MILLIVVATGTLVLSFACSLFEAALYSITPGEVEMRAARGDRSGLLLRRLREQIEEPIAAILTVNTVAHTVGATWCGALAADLWGGAAVGIFAAVFTLLVLAVTEIVPKSLGVRHAAALAPRLAWAIQLMIWSVWPVARPARAIMGWLAGSAGARGPSEDEILVLARLAARSGGVRREEAAWIRGALRLDRVLAREIMTPRRVVERLSAALTVEEAARLGESWVHSRVLLHASDDEEQLLGLVLRREIVDAALRGEGKRSLTEFARPLRFVPETAAAHGLLRIFLAERVHLVAVVDEYGGFEGVVSLEDVLEAVLGEQIVDEHDRHEDLQVLARALSPLEDEPRADEPS